MNDAAPEPREGDRSGSERSHPAMNERRLLVLAGVGIAAVLLLGVVGYFTLLLRLSAPGVAHALEIVGIALLATLTAVQLVLLRVIRRATREQRERN